MTRKRGPPEPETPDPNGRTRPSSSSNPNSNPNPPQNPPISTTYPWPQLSSVLSPPTAHQTPPVVATTMQQPPIPQQQHVRLFRADGSSADGRTLFVDLHPESQRLMLQVHERIQQYKGESELIDQSSRLSETPRDYFGLEVARICQELRELSSIAETKTTEVRKLMPAVRDLMSVVEVAVNSFWRNKQMLLHTNASTFYMDLPVRPTPFLQNTIQRFEDELKECCDWIDKHEGLIYLNSCGPHSSSSSLQAIKETMSNNYALILHLADKVEKLHQTMESIKKNFLLDRRQQGQESDPFLEANRREAARQAAATRRVHPTIHLSSVGVQPFTAAGSFPSSAMLQQSVGSSIVSSDGWHQTFSTPSPSGSPYFPPCNPTPVMNFVPPSTSQFGSTANPTLYRAPSTTPSTSGAAGGSGSGSNRTPTRSSSKYRHNYRNRR